MKNTYAHGGSVWKSLFLLLRGIINLAAFCGVWVGAIFWSVSGWGSTMFWISAVALILCVVFHLLLPLLRLLR